MQARKIWLVAQRFPPINSIGAERPKKIFNYLTEAGNDVSIFTILAPLNGGNSPKFANANVWRSRVHFPGFHFQNEISISPFRLFFARALTTLFDDSGWTWMNGLKRDLWKAIKSERPDLVIVTGRPFLTFITVARFCKKNGIPFILDYRDSWSNNPHSSYYVPFRRTLLSWAERWLNDRASGLLTVSRHTGKALNTIRKPLIIYNFPDATYAGEVARYLGKKQSCSYLNLCFAGTLYPGRDLDPVCKAISKTPKAIRDKIRFHYCGTSSIRAQASFKRHGVSDVFCDHGSLTKDQSMNLIYSSDISVSIISSDDEKVSDALKGVISTKIFDYLLMQKQVLNIVPDGFEISELSKDINMLNVSSFSPSNVDSITCYLNSFFSKGSKVEDLSQVSDYDRHKLVSLWDDQMKEFGEFMDGIIS